jgi:glycosyltransferase involved in cell wall biosynthesis
MGFFRQSIPAQSALKIAKGPSKLGHDSARAANDSGLGLDQVSAERARISVVIPAYNAAAFLPATLASVFAQSELPAEVIVVDDGSTDDTAAVARSCGATVISVRNGGGSAARNVGTRAAAGEYIAYLDADDIWAPEKLALQLDALESFVQPAFSFTDHLVFDELGVHAGRGGLRAHPAFRRTVGPMLNDATILIAADDTRPVLSDMYFLPASVLVRRVDVLAVGGFDESLRGSEDYEFFLRLFRLVPAIAVMQPLLFYRRHPAQVTASEIAVIEREFEIQRRIAAAPERYTRGDVTYSASKDYILHYRAGVCQARLGQFDESIVSLRKSLAARRTLRAVAVLAVSRCARGGLGRVTFEALRALRRRRTQRRIAGPDWFRQVESIGRSG